MAMRLGDSLPVSTSGTSHVVSSASNGAKVAVSTPGQQCHPNARIAGCRPIFGGVPSLESRYSLVRHASKHKPKRTMPALIIRAAKSVDAPESAPSPSTSNDQSNQKQSHFDLLERMTENSTTSQGNQEGKTIRDQLSSQVEPEATEVTVPLATSSSGGPDQRDAPPPKELTISQKRNIRRQNYLNKVSERNDAPFFAAVAGFVLVPPLLILGVAVATGYVEFFP